MISDTSRPSSLLFCLTLAVAGLALATADSGAEERGLLLQVKELQARDKNRIGQIVAFPGKSIPVGWKLCNGDVVTESQYPELFKAIGEIYGDGKDGKGAQFNLPDLRGVFLRGLDSGRGLDKGRKLGAKFQEHQFGRHNHSTDLQGHDHEDSNGKGVTDSNSVAHGVGASVKKGARVIYAAKPGHNAGGHRHAIYPDGGNETRPVNMAVQWIIYVGS